MLKKTLIAKTNGKANSDQFFKGNGYRITVLSSRLIRFEANENNHFNDLPSETVWNRCFDAPSFSVKEQNGIIAVETDDVIFSISKSSMKPKNVYFKDSKTTAKCNNGGNLKGTRRTLDMTFGKVPLNDGLITKNGVYVLDDSDMLLLDESGMFKRREQKGHDLYIFAFGHDYRDTIRAFYTISSPVPIIPRYALGVWWSRYRKYTQKEYIDLIESFKKEEIPLTVATIDMDWHWTDLKTEFGKDYQPKMHSDKPLHSGWTGYSWNTKLFPDYKALLNYLKDENLRITLNLHPADGVRFYETQYKEMAKAMKVDPASKKTIPFVCGSTDFWNAYFDILHKPFEKDGVDFWWIDWQHGKKWDVKGLDPLTALNHFHYLDNAENGQIPLILSRYSGLGSHRYPLGFSGDTAINWSVLDFQPYFTANAANAAYTWWSHDIGGHHRGYRDDELYIRWLQFGVFSPIMRLHSTADDLLGKEPWKYRADVYAYAKQWLCLRHRLIPYIYTMDYRTHKDGTALCEPMYYSYPENENAYHVKNQYMFGSELMVCPITTKHHEQTGLSSVTAWIPKGRWTDIFTGQSYTGEQVLELHRELDTIPVLAKEGAIIPLSLDEGNSTENPKALELLAFSGNSTFTLYEDNGKTDFDSHHANTAFEIKFNEEKKTLNFTINKADGDISVLPQKRDYKIVFKDITAKDVSANAEVLCETGENNCAVIHLHDISVNEKIEITATVVERIVSPPKKEQLVEIMSRWQESTRKKKSVYRVFQEKETTDQLMDALNKSNLPKAVSSAILERFMCK